MLNNIGLLISIVVITICTISFFYFDRKEKTDKAVNSIIVGILALLFGLPLLMNFIHERDFSKFHSYEEKGYHIIASYGVLSDAYYPDTESCIEKDSLIFLSKDMKEVDNVAQAKYAACK